MLGPAYMVRHRRMYGMRESRRPSEPLPPSSVRRMI
jgi:hypothetical protein